MPKLMQPVSSDERIRAREEIIAALDRGDIELGDAIRRMRREWTGLSQGRFGKIAGLSANTMSAVERNAESATVKTLNQILKRFGMRLTLRQISAHNKLTEQELLKGLDAYTAHADELADPLPQELTPLERLRGSIKRYDRPTDPVWDEFLGSNEGVSDDFIEDSGQVLGKALCNAAEVLGLSKTEVAGIIGRERTGIVRDGIDPNSKAGELALMLIRVYRGLYAAVGGDQENMRHWMDTENQYFGQSPRKMMATCQGLVRVLMYLDAIRGYQSVGGQI